MAVVRKLVRAIRGEDPERLIISDGLQWGTVPVPELHGLYIAQAARGYTPMEISHYGANWVNSEHYPSPQWPRSLPPNGTLLSPKKPEGSHPLVIDGPFTTATELRLHVLTGLAMQDRAWLWKTCIEPWKAVESKGTGVMVGEWGAFNKTPHEVVLRWAEDCLSNWRKAGWGWAMWNFRGPFGVLDSDRGDVQYEDFEGHKLDRKLLDLLQRY